MVIYGAMVVLSIAFGKYIHRKMKLKGTVRVNTICEACGLIGS